MSVDVYKKVAVEALARLKGKSPAVVALVSSSAKVDVRHSGAELVKAFTALKEDAFLADRFTQPCHSAAEADALLGELTEKHRLTVLALPCLREEDGAMLLTAAAGSAILAERRNLSRTDEIGQALELLHNLNVEALGFLLE